MNEPIKERPILFSAPMVLALLAGTKTQTRRVAKLTDTGRLREIGSNRNWHPDDPNASLASPYGQPAERLWVRETHSVIGEKCFYRASIPYGNLDCHFKPWKPSIFMRRKSSRITLEIASVRVERLNDISREDAIAEGLKTGPYGFKYYGELEKLNQWSLNPIWSYQSLWESINGAGSWALNPWVWVVKFKRITP